MKAPLLKKSKRGRKNKKEKELMERKIKREANIPEMDIDKLTKISEADPELTSNLTGGQIQDVLDTLILQAIYPIILQSDVFDMQISYILALTAKNKKRKLSALPREDSINMMCQFLTTRDRQKKADILATMKLERGFIYNFVVKFLRETKSYIPMYQDNIVMPYGPMRDMMEKKLSVVERSVGLSRNSLFHTINTSEDFLRLAYEFRNSIVMNYLKHAYKQARSFVSMKGANFDFYDVYQNFLTAITKAVDKYDSSKGALTSYINYWVLNAQTTSNSLHGHEYGVAYSIPQLQKKALAEKSNKAQNINFGISLEKMVGKEGEETELGEYIAGDHSTEEDIERNEELDIIRYLAKRADIRGIARLYLDIDEYFSPKEIRKMIQAMEKQLGIVPADSHKYRKIRGKISGMHNDIKFVPKPPKIKAKKKRKADLKLVVVNKEGSVTQPESKAQKRKDKKSEAVVLSGFKKKVNKGFKFKPKSKLRRLKSLVIK